MPLSPKQKKLVHIKNMEETIIVLTGAVRSGKTLYGCTIGWFEHIIKQQKEKPMFEGAMYMVVGASSSKNAYRNVTSRLIEYGKSRGFKVRKTSPQSFDYEFKRNDIKFHISTYAVKTEFSWEQWH